MLREFERRISKSNPICVLGAFASIVTCLVMVAQRMTFGGIDDDLALLAVVTLVQCSQWHQAPTAKRWHESLEKLAWGMWLCMALLLFCITFTQNKQAPEELVALGHFLIAPTIIATAAFATSYFACVLAGHKKLF